VRLYCVKEPVAPPAVSGAHGNTAVLDSLKLEALMSNLDASLRVCARSQFFSWTQGLLQTLIRHEVLICALRQGAPLSFRVDSFSTLAPDASLFSELFQSDASLAPSLVKLWKERRFQPVLCRVAETSPLRGGAFARELERVGATQLVAHGCQDAAGEAASFFVFACRATAADFEQAYLAQLAVPFVHAAWVRAQSNASVEGGRLAPAGAGVLTAREHEILRWIYLGKSNFEVGEILKISPLTVKNHVQKILRKLKVVNRTQAVGKALDTRILAP
jgi:transcriptional regulator EpsA